MKKINSYISEKLHINKDIKVETYCPRTTNELRSYIKKILNRDGWNADLNCIDTSNITNMDELFDGFIKIENIDISGWDVSNVTSMASMFFYCKKFNCDISSWDVSKVTNMNNMFYNCESFNYDLSDWNTKSLDETGKQNTFYKCKALIDSKKLPKWYNK